ncbi:unnamed protein product [Heligmosomoides polygyrus]|uniref:Uncharacterized protein n=1 Tax=Heligmosomoides polygyrus TaxID=6339 RepID=A0A3P7X1A6_HELPZ|nr:unnamed protein product [Heligmosomoides polygyrus]
MLIARYLILEKISLRSSGRGRNESIKSIASQVTLSFNATCCPCFQRYFKNAQWAMPGGPSFIMIGGEGPESPKWVLNENITYLTWAKKFGATVYLLEHRYYGESVVLGYDSTSNYYLSSLQMLYDVANFIRNVNSQTGAPTTWITFGGSYSGALSLWMRQLFPDVVQGAVGSSAPVEAKLDFYGSLGFYEYCFQGFDSMHQLVLTGDGRSTLSDIFSLAPLWDNATDVSETDVQYFFSNIYSQFQGAVQYSGDNTGGYANGYGIPELCAFMTNETNDPVENIAQFNQYMTVFYSDGVPFNHTENSYQAFVEYLRTAQDYGPDAASSRLWTWQTCTEFGYFQSSDSGYSIFGSPTPVNLYTQMCSDVFGKQYSAAAIQQSVLRTNYRYGGRANYKGTNVAIPNGSLDPWHALGKYTSNDPSVVWYLINGTAHCADMYPARPEDEPDLSNARQLIEVNLVQWLSDTPATKGATTTTRGTTTVAMTSNVKSPSPTPVPAHESSTPTGSAFHHGEELLKFVL